MSYNQWLYVYANPINFVDPSGLIPTVYGIEIDDKFTEEEQQLILETFADYSEFLGGNNVLQTNLALTEIKQDWLSATGAYNAAYNFLDKSITLQPGWYSAVITTAPNGKVMIILGPPCFEEMLDFPEGSLPTAEIGAKFVLAHEMTHALAFGNPTTFSSFTDNVDVPWSFLAWFSSNPIIRRNAGRSIDQEVFADVIPAYIYSPGLLNQQMNDWVQTTMPDTLK